MTNKKESAFPLCNNGFIENHGLTKLEYFTAMAMQGLCADNALRNIKESYIAERSVEFAKATLRELEKEEK